MYAETRISHNWLIKKAVNDKVRERLPDLYGNVLDFGCGLRPFETDILRHATDYVGIDWSDTLHGMRADIISNLNAPLPFANEAADHIVSFEVMEHLAEPRIMLAEAFRILRHGGQLTLSVPFQWWLHEAPWDYYRYTRYGLHYMLEHAGFSDVSVAPTTGFWSMWILKLNYQTTRLIRGSSPARALIRAGLIPFWWVNQHLALLADRYWPEERETAGYFVTAVKP
ncbi:methyltransferase domain-containing protein [Luteimonas sp. R10]|uniref:methyltransferase domain-containing protein n=1 Tax=Luteimonas sp. R10 TaxID=3108176 RepID=UPI00308D2D00|nr:methyltransferase domain-containing protein [Luteimonas sp. R10]